MSLPYTLPDVVDLPSAKAVAAEVLAHLREAERPVIDATGLRRAGVPLLQILVAGRTMAEAEGKSLAVTVGPGSVLPALLSQCGLDPALCGVVESDLPGEADIHSERT